jgi:hypothetical protein
MEIKAKGRISFATLVEGQTDTTNEVETQFFDADGTIVANYPVGDFAWSRSPSIASVANRIVVIAPEGKFSIAVDRWDVESYCGRLVDIFKGEFEYNGCNSILDGRSGCNWYFIASSVSYSGYYSQDWITPEEYLVLANRSNALLGDDYLPLVTDEPLFWSNWIEFLRTEKALDLEKRILHAKAAVKDLLGIADYIMATAKQSVLNESPLGAKDAYSANREKSLDELCLDGEEITY